MIHVNLTYVGKGLKVVLKVDEMWAFIAKKKQPRWLWWVEDALNGKVVGFVFGRRTHQTFRRLLALLEATQIQVVR